MYNVTYAPTVLVSVVPDVDDRAMQEALNRRAAWRGTPRAAPQEDLNGPTAGPRQVSCGPATALAQR